MRYDVYYLYWFDGEFYSKLNAYDLETAATNSKTAKLIFNDAGEVTGVEELKA